MEIVRPSCEIGHVEGHVKLKRRSELRTQKVTATHGVEKEWKETLTVSVRWSRFTDEKRRRSLQQNLRIVVIFNIWRKIISIWRKMNEEEEILELINEEKNKQIRVPFEFSRHQSF